MDVGDDRHARRADDLRSAASIRRSGQDTRMMSTPASSQRRIWSIVALASAVGVLVIVWTVTGASPPTAHGADHDLARLAPLDISPGTD